MENIRRNIKLFFVTYGGLLFQLIGGIILIFLILRGVNTIFKENAKTNSEGNNLISQEEKEKRESEIKINQENEKFISKFIDYCNEGKIEEAYGMLSQECINEKYPTIEKFKNEYINKIFTYKKEFKITKESDDYKIEIFEGALESGNIENRKSVVSYVTIKENVFGKAIIIER